MVTAAAPAGAQAERRIAPTVQVSVMTQNIFYGGDDYQLSTGRFCPVADGCPHALHRLAHIIAASGADVVGVQEAERNTRRLAELLGWHASPRAHVISRFPILDPPHSHGLFTYVEPVPGRVIAVANTHLPSTPYGPYRARAGWSHDRVMRLERTLRLKALAPVLKRLPRLAARGIPVFLTGDFNSPSYLDWTPKVARARADVPYAVRWPASKALADAGFGDSYRDAHPDPVADPGFTWSPGGPETLKHDIPDRIDWVLHAGPSTTVSSRLVGEQGNPQVDLAFPPPYPTDHRGVVSTFDLTPASAPVMVSPSARRVISGSGGLHVRFHAKGTATERIGFRPAGHPNRPPVAACQQAVVRTARDAADRAPPPGPLRRRPLRRGRGPQDDVAPIWVYGARSHSRLTADRHSYREGAAIRVHWTRAPGNNLDWIGLYRCHRTCGGPGSYLVYRYTRTDVEGSATFNAHVYLGEATVAWPLPPGQYVARLLVDDSYHSLGTSPRFRITRR